MVGGKNSSVISFNAAFKYSMNLFQVSQLKVLLTWLNIDYHYCFSGPSILTQWNEEANMLRILTLLTFLFSLQIRNTNVFPIGDMEYQSQQTDNKSVLQYRGRISRLIGVSRSISVGLFTTGRSSGKAIPYRSPGWLGEDAKWRLIPAPGAPIFPTPRADGAFKNMNREGGREQVWSTTCSPIIQSAPSKLDSRRIDFIYYWLISKGHFSPGNPFHPLGMNHWIIEHGQKVIYSDKK